MKMRILFTALVGILLMSSCATHCGNKSYRTKRYVQNEQQQSIAPDAARLAKV